MGGFDMDKTHLLQLLEQVRDQEGDWRVALEDAIDMVDNFDPTQGQTNRPTQGGYGYGH